MIFLTNLYIIPATGLYFCVTFTVADLRGVKWIIRSFIWNWSSLWRCWFFFLIFDTVPRFPSYKSFLVNILLFVNCKLLYWDQHLFSVSSLFSSILCVWYFWMFIIKIFLTYRYTRKPRSQTPTGATPEACLLLLYTSSSLQARSPLFRFLPWSVQFYLIPDFLRFQRQGSAVLYFEFRLIYL